MRLQARPQTRLARYERIGMNLLSAGRVGKLLPVRFFVFVLSFFFGEERVVFGYRLSIFPPWSNIVEREAPEWPEDYSAPSVRGKTVLDIGAGCGETAALFLANGAKRVVAVESNVFAYEMLRRNSAGLPIVPILGEFRLSQLDIPHDFMKMDIEGSEALLLGYDGDLGECAIEAHDGIVPGISTKLCNKFGLEHRHHPFGDSQLSILASPARAARKDRTRP